MSASDAERNWMRDHGRSPTVVEFEYLKSLREPPPERTNMPTSPPREPGGKRISSRPVILELELERDRLVDRAHKALDEAEAEIVDLRRQLRLAANGEPYRRVPGAGQVAMNSASGLDTATVSAAFDALERVATIKHLEDSDGDR